MHDWLARLRGLLDDDRRVAYQAEHAELRAATKTSAFDPRFEAEMADLAHSADAISLGTTVATPRLSVRVPVREVVGNGHLLCLGGTGAGKTRVVSGIALDLLRRIATAPDAMGLWVIDHKSEFVALLRELLYDLVDELPGPAARALLDRLVVIDPFSTSLVPMQVLKPEPGVAPEVQAYVVASLINRMGGADLGVRQDHFLFHLLLLGVRHPGGGLSLVDLARLLNDPDVLVGVAANSPSEDVRGFFRAGVRLAQQSLDGVRARLHALLRLPSNRHMLGAKDAASFRRLLARNVVLIDLGAAPDGCRDLAHFWAGLMTLKVTNAIFARTPAESQRPVAVMIDEWQEGLAAGSELAEDYERVLSMARFKGVSLHLISQSLAGAAKSRRRSRRSSRPTPTCSSSSAPLSRTPAR